MQVRSEGWEDPLEKEMATCSSILAMDRGAWWARVQGGHKMLTRLSTRYHPGALESDTSLCFPWGSLLFSFITLLYPTSPNHRKTSWVSDGQISEVAKAHVNCSHTEHH